MRGSATEKQVDQALVAAVKEVGGIAPKFGTVKAYGSSGMPDRLVLLNGGISFWVECKAPGKTATKRQRAKHTELWNLGHHVYLYDEVGVQNARRFVLSCAAAVLGVPSISNSQVGRLQETYIGYAKDAAQYESGRV